FSNRQAPERPFDRNCAAGRCDARHLHVKFSFGSARREEIAAMSQRKISVWALVISTALTFNARWAYASGGSVLSPSATPFGYNLTDMAQALAYFDTSGNKHPYYPSTPFQILYVENSHSGVGRFTVSPITMFFVPVFFLDNSPPVIGDFPTISGDPASYVF